MTDNSFSIDVAAIRDRARQKMDRGPVTEYYGTDPAKVVEVLNEVLATEIVCWMRYSLLNGLNDKTRLYASVLYVDENGIELHIIQVTSLSLVERAQSPGLLWVYTRFALLHRIAA